MANKSNAAHEELLKASNCKWLALEETTSMRMMIVVSRGEFEVLTHNFRALNPMETGAGGVEKVDRQHFRDLLSEKFGMTESLLMDRGASLIYRKNEQFPLAVVFRVFDSDADNHISFEEYIKGMSVFLKGKLEERMKCKTVSSSSFDH